MSKIDIIDTQIVDLLMEDGRMPAAEIARRIGGISQRVVRYRIDRMVKERMITICTIHQHKTFNLNDNADVVVEIKERTIKKVTKD